MKLGIVADIHEEIDSLAEALSLLRREAVDQIVVLGDLFETGKRINETATLLADVGAIGVWGNHDLGLCHEPEELIRSRYAGAGLDFLLTLRPRLEIGGYLFTHGLPCWNPTDPTIFYLGDRPESEEGRRAAFTAFSCRAAFVGHFHRWLLAMPEGKLDWNGGGPAELDSAQRYLVVVAAVSDGWCATFDTEKSLLLPWRLCGSE
jgi:predicted phosphodiesterase